MEKERVTITISKDLLEKVDNSVDGAGLRNRSHAIEFYVRKAIGSTIDTAFILAGDNKIRFHTLSRRIPKTMIPVNNRPVAEHLIEWLKDHGFKRFVFGIGYKKEKLKEYFGDGSDWGVEIIYSEAHKTGTSGSLIEAKDFLEGSRFIVVDGDVLTRFDLRELLKFHEKNDAVVTVALKSIANPKIPVAELEGSKIVKFIKKPGKEVHSNLVNAGVYVMSPLVFEYARPKESIKKDLLPHIAGEGVLYGYPFSGPWIEVNDGKSAKRAEDIW
ncbi:NTP transferase domain-containing protein [archaeon]|nr:NTP transferase domain-containing protein [archaeon]